MHGEYPGPGAYSAYNSDPTKQRGSIFCKKQVCVLNLTKVEPSHMFVSTASRMVFPENDAPSPQAYLFSTTSLILFLCMSNRYNVEPKWKSKAASSFPQASRFDPFLPKDRFAPSAPGPGSYDSATSRQPTRRSPSPPFGARLLLFNLQILELPFINIYYFIKDQSAGIKIRVARNYLALANIRK